MTHARNEDEKNDDHNQTTKIKIKIKIKKATHIPASS